MGYTKLTLDESFFWWHRLLYVLNSQGPLLANILKRLLRQLWIGLGLWWLLRCVGTTEAGRGSWNDVRQMNFGRRGRCRRRRRRRARGGRGRWARPLGRARLLLLKSFRYAIAHSLGSFYSRRFYVMLNTCIVYDCLVLKDENPSGGFFQSWKWLGCVWRLILQQRTLFSLRLLWIWGL